MSITKEEMTSSADVNMEQECNQATNEVTHKEHLTENDGTIPTHQTCKDEHKTTNKTDKTVMTVDDSTLIKFRNNFFEVTV